MPKYIVEYKHEVVITYQAEVTANSEEEAIQNIEDGYNIESEVEMDYQGMKIDIKDVYLSEEGDEWI